MVDDNEFIKRRHLSRGRPRKYEPSPISSTTSPPPQLFSATTSLSLENDCGNKNRCYEPMLNGPEIDPIDYIEENHQNDDQHQTE